MTEKNTLLTAASDGIRAAIEAGKEIAALAHPTTNAHGELLVAVPEGFSLHREKPLTPWLASNIAASRTLIEAGSFADYINIFKQSTTLIFGSPHQMKMEAVIDYHGAADGTPAPNHCTHRAIFDMRYDPNWERWRNIDRRDMSQVDFAYFIEEMMHTIAAPDGGDLLEMAQTLKVNRNVVFKSNKRLASGEMDIQFTEEDSTTSAGNVGVPDELTVVCPIHFDGSLATIPIKLRYKLDPGKPLQFRFDILNREIVEMKAFRSVAEDIQEQTGIGVLLSN